MGRCVVALVLLAACSDDQVTGRIVDHYVAPADVMVPADRGTYKYQAFVHTSTGWATSLETQGTPAGTFEIDDLPEGPVVLRRVDRYGAVVWRDLEDRQWTITDTWEGRPDAESIDPSEPDDLDLSIANDKSGLAFGDSYLLDVWGTGDQIDVPSLATPVKFQQASSYGDLGPHLIQPSHGDSLVAYHMTQVGEYPNVSTLSQMATLDVADEQHGVPLAASGAFVDVAQGASITLSIDLDACSALFGVAVGQPVSWDISVVAGPAVGRGMYQGPTLVEVSDVTSTGKISVMQAMPVLPDPTWQVAVLATFQATSGAPLPGIPTGNFYSQGFSTQTPRTMPDFDVTLPASLPPAATIDGQPIHDFAMVPEGFVLSVEGAPSFTATLEQEMSIEQDAEYWQPVADFDSSSDHLWLPPDVLTAGPTYTFVINVGGVWMQTPTFTVM